jgi:uncharacterized protein YndB with AHSA1/START domain
VNGHNVFFVVETPMSTGRIELHRMMRTQPARLYEAFVNPQAWAKWLPPHGFFATVHSHEARVGGEYQMSFTQLNTGQSHRFGGRYLELVPGQHLCYTARFDDPHLPGEMRTTVSMENTAFGVDLRIVQEGIPAAIPLQACYLGWQESLQLLAYLVQADVPE